MIGDLKKLLRDFYDEYYYAEHALPNADMECGKVLKKYTKKINSLIKGTDYQLPRKIFD